MPSDVRLAGAAPQSTPWAWLWSQGLGILCGQATVLLLAVGSVVLAITREGASARIAMDDFRAFFEPPSPVHAWFYLLVRPGSVPAAARLARGSARCRAEFEGSCELGGLEVRLLYVHPPGRPGMGSLARVGLRGAPVAGSKELWLMEGRPVRLADGSVLALEGVEEQPGIQLRRRHAPGNPWALAASILLVLGLGMMWRRFLWAGREEPENPG